MAQTKAMTNQKWG